jgi:mycothiol synthase
VKIEAFDHAGASDAELVRYHDLHTSIELEAVPEDEPQPFADFAGWLRIAPAARKTWAWVVWDDDRKRILARSFFMLIEEEANQTLGSFWVDVRPEVRRQGVGLRLLEPLVDVARDHRRTLLDANARPAIPAGAAFLAAVGAEHRFNARINALDIAQVDLNLLHAWADRAKERATDYRLEAWDAPCPDDHVEAFVAAESIMNTAPREGFDMEDEVFTVHQLREREAANAERGLEQWIITAVHEPTGEIAGYTEIALPSHWPSRAYQGDTGVDPAHRDKGLGRWLKAAMLLRLVDERPAVRRITTQNAGSNEPMLNINHELGFRCIEERPVYQVPLDVLTERIAR